MDLKQYKMVRSKNFPLPTPKKQQQCIDTNIKTIAILNSPQSESYQIHHIGNGEVVMFGQREYLKRYFDYVVIGDSEEKERVEEQAEEEEKKEDMVSEILSVVEERVSAHSHNLIIVPILNSEQMGQVIFPKMGYAMKEGSEIPETPNSMIKNVISSMLKSKRGNTVVSLSIMGINSNGTLTDELNYDWLEETEDIQKAMRDKVPLKVRKEKKEVKTFDLNRQQISNWEDAREILYHYHQLSQYVEHWRNYEDEGALEGKMGEIYEISEVEVDVEYGSILQTVKKCYILRINQYYKRSNLIMMRVSQALNELLTNTKSKNTRDYPLMMFLNEPFTPSKKYQVTLFSQLGLNDTLKEEVVCMSMNLQVPATHVYLKNFWDNQKILEEVQNLKSISDEKEEGNHKQTSKVNEKSLRLLEESQKVVAKSFYNETKSSHEKRKPPSERNKGKVSFPSESEDEMMNSALLEVYGKKRFQEKMQNKLVNIPE